MTSGRRRREKFIRVIGVILDDIKNVFAFLVYFSPESLRERRFFACGVYEVFTSRQAFGHLPAAGGGPESRIPAADSAALS